MVLADTFPCHSCVTSAECSSVRFLTTRLRLVDQNLYKMSDTWPFSFQNAASPFWIQCSSVSQFMKLNGSTEKPDSHVFNSVRSDRSASGQLLDRRLEREELRESAMLATTLQSFLSRIIRPVKDLSCSLVPARFFCMLGACTAFRPSQIKANAAVRPALWWRPGCGVGRLIAP